MQTEKKNATQSGDAEPVADPDVKASTKGEGTAREEANSVPPDIEDKTGHH